MPPAPDFQGAGGKTAFGRKKLKSSEHTMNFGVVYLAISLYFLYNISILVIWAFPCALRPHRRRDAAPTREGG
ncbi:hypothetical protein OBV_23350 [Oscillibacter valericigenes Sjm18-20]|nr:hypothetical protein OBV_23350 [Oscillibacter valericigenes Sjm18-20]